MIELDLSYEESTKILELGYDFGRKFGDIYKKRDCPHKYMLVNYEKIKAQDLLSQIEEKYHDTYIERFTLERQSRDYEDSLYNNKHNEYFELGEILSNPNSEGFVPMIPKGALEKCLINKIFGNVALSNKTPICYGRRFEKIFDKGCPSEFSVWEITGGDSIQGGLTTYFPSVFEAFLWLHENYPEELKKKFDEVMGGET